MKHTLARLTLLTGLSATLPTFGSDYTWRNLDLDWWDASAWTTDGAAATWANGNTAVLNAGPADLTISLSQDTRMTSLTVRDSYTFTDGTLTVHGNLYVAADKTVSVESKLNQDNASDVKYRLVKGAPGTLAVRGGATLKRFQQNAGTTRVENGCTFTVSGSSEKTKTVDGTDGVAASFTGGSFIVTDGAKFTMSNAGAKYLTTSGAMIGVEDGGVFDAWNVGEVLHAFKDNSTATSIATSTFDVNDGGLLMAKKFRIGNATETQFKNAETCARVRLNAGGVASVAEWNSHTAGYYGELLFNGGTWLMTNTTTSTAMAYPFGNPEDDEAAWTKKWANIRVTVGEGGAHLRNLSQMKRKICKPFEGGAQADGGLHIEGAGYVYMAATNTFNGGTWLEGTGYYIPRDDRAFGAVPDVPTNNIFIANSSAILHFDDEAEIHQNRNVLISSNTAMRVGNSKNATLKGTISTAGADPAASVLRVLNIWDGALTLAPADGRTNALGRIEARGHLVLADGVTRVLKDTEKTTGTSAAVYVGNLAANNKDAGTAFEASKGVLEVTGGRVEVATTSYVFLDKYGQLKVSGGTFDASASREILNGMNNTPSAIEVSGTGTLEAGLLRISNMSDAEKALDDNDLPLASVHVATGGVLRLTRFSLDTAATRYGRLDLDGGTVACRETRNDFLGVSDATQANAWTGIVVRACAGGAVFDTNGTTNHVRRPIISGVAEGEVDGGVTKRGEGRLALMGGANSYTGKTRVDAGTLIFPSKGNFPGGDLEISASAIVNQPRETALIETYAMKFRDGAKIRIVETKGAEDFGKAVIVARVTGKDETITNLPKAENIVVVDENGVEKPVAADGKWALRLSADGTTLRFGRHYGLSILVR